MMSITFADELDRSTSAEVVDGGRTRILVLFSVDVDRMLPDAREELEEWHLRKP